MLVVVSPAKNLDMTSPIPTTEYTQPELLGPANELAEHCKRLSPAELGSLMSISDKLATLNAERFDSFQLPFTPDNARQSAYMFNGDVYAGLDAYSLEGEGIDYAQQHLRILSGLYGVLRPLDLIQPYRLEMGTKLDNPRGKNLYEFWSHQIADSLNTAMSELSSRVLVNLASNEYFKSVDKKTLDAEIITPAFKDKKNGQYKMISFFAKKARGLMARYIIDNRLSTPDQLQSFDINGYYYSEEASQPNQPVFLREEQ